MKLFRRTGIALGVGLVLVAASYAHGTAAEFPARPVRIVVPSTPGGALDILSRMLAQKLPDRWGQPLVIDNRPGAGGVIGTEIVAKADADGHTLLVVALGYAANPFLYSKLPYRTPQDFTPVGILATAPNVLVAHPSLPARSVRELIAFARAKPDSVVYASSGVGTSGHLAMELFKRMANVQMVHVPYKGAGAANAAVVAGQVQLLNTSLGAAFPHIKSGRLRALAVTSAKRAAVAPDIPTAEESGLAGYVVDGWFAALAPAKTPPRLVGRIHDEFARVYAMPDVAERITSMGFEAGRLTPQETAAFIAQEMAMWQKVIREAGIRGE